MLRTGSATLLAAAMLFLGACSENGSERRAGDVAPTPRRMVVWLDADGVDAETAGRLAASGVDQLVVRRGAVLLSGRAPVVQMLPNPVVEGSIPTAVALEVRGLASKTDDHAADAVWSALEADFGGQLPSELILDLPDTGPSAADFVRRLAQQSGLAVVPVLSISQLQTDEGRAVAETAHRCIVPVFGSQGADLRGLDDLGTQPLKARLAAIRDLDIRIRIAVALRPRTEPEVSAWAEDVDGLTDGEVAEIKRSSALDRSFAIRRPVTWGGVAFAAGQTLAVSWVDTSKLNLYLGESQRMVLPEIGGWDLVSLPPPGNNLGLDREELIGYLAGEGPDPAVDVRVGRSGRSVTVSVVNPSPFRSAVTGFGNWVQLELERGALVTSSRGNFDRVILGSVRSGEWQPNPPGGPNAVRFVETYLAPGEELKTGTIRLPSSRSRITVRWQIQLSDGRTVGGVVD